MRQDEDEFTEQSSEDVRPHSSSYRQTLSLDPIASQSLNLETSATRLGRVLLVSTDRIYRICTFTHTHIYIYLSLYVIITIIARIIQIGPTARRCRSPMSPRPFATQPLWGARRGLEHWDSMTHKHGEHRSLTMFNQQTGRYSPTCFWRMDS